MSLSTAAEVLAQRAKVRERFPDGVDREDNFDRWLEVAVATTDGGFAVAQFTGEMEDDGEPILQEEIGSVRFIQGRDNPDLRVVVLKLGDTPYFIGADSFFAGLHEALHLFECHEGGCPGCVSAALEPPWRPEEEREPTPDPIPRNHTKRRKPRRRRR